MPLVTWDKETTWLGRTFGKNFLVTALSGAPVLWAFLRDDGTPANRIHRSFQRAEWREADPGFRFVLAGGFLLLPLTTLGLVAYCTWRRGSAVRRGTGKSLSRQVLEQIDLALRCAIMPPWYYIFDLNDPARRSRAREYLLRVEYKDTLYPLLRKYGARGDAEVTTDFLRDKATFPERCARFGAAAVPSLLVAEGGSIRHLTDSGEGLPERDLFFKPRSGAGGRGAERWRFLGGGRYRSHDGREVSGSELLEHLKRLSAERPYVVRPVAENHPAIADLSSGALNTVRMVTCRNEVGDFEVTHASYRMARGRDSIVDNFHAGGISARVDLGTGELGRATDTGTRPDTDWFEHHPVTGARILGRRLPDWPECLDVVRRAHAGFADQVVVGWDLAITPQGPQLIEGNKSPDLDIIQRTHEMPIGNSRLGELLAHHLELALESAGARTAAPARNGVTDAG